MHLSASRASHVTLTVAVSPSDSPTSDATRTTLGQGQSHSLRFSSVGLPLLFTTRDAAIRRLHKKPLPD